MMLVVIGHEAEPAVIVHDVSVEHGLVPVAHSREIRGPDDEVGEQCGCDRFRTYRLTRAAGHVGCCVHGKSSCGWGNDITARSRLQPSSDRPGSVARPNI